MVVVFRDVRRVLRADGTLWLNLGDTYAGGGNGGSGSFEHHRANWRKVPARSGQRNAVSGLKPKDLCGIPWRVAFALQADGWWLRQDIIWSKPNPMPESVTDRCTKAHEYLFLISKSERYYFDQDAILEDCSPNTHARLSQDIQAQIGSERAHAGSKTNGNMKAVGRHLPGNKTHRGKTACEDGDEKHRTKVGLVDYAERQRALAGVGPKTTAAGSGIKNNESFAAACSMPVTSRNKRSVWTVATQPFSEAHFATFPPALIEPCILAGCPKGGTVLDPFGGAGTTGLVADRLQRDAILIELNPEYAAMAQRRIANDAPLFA
jgi:DNA modification methylase